MRSQIETCLWVAGTGTVAGCQTFGRVGSRFQADFNMMKFA